MEGIQLEEGERHVIDESVPLKPSYTRTWPIQLFNYLLDLSGVSGRGLSGASAESEVANGDETSESSEIEGNGKVSKVPINVAPAVKAGGRRRKGGKR